MSFFEDYVQDGLCCQICGQVIDFSEPGYPRSGNCCDKNVKKTKRQPVKNGWKLIKEDK